MTRSGTLLCLVCGFQHSGTTMLSELLRQHPGVDGRFEAGFLMGKRPSYFESTGSYPRFVRRFWGVDDKGMKKLTACGSFSQMYDTLVQVSNLPDKSVQIYDKTPAYMGDLRNVMKKVNVPVIVSVKDPRAIMGSIKRRKGKASAGQVSDHLTRYANSYKLARRIWNNRILLVRNEHLCTEPEKYGKQIFDFLGIEWDDEYIKLENCYSMHDNVYGVKQGKPRGIVADRLTEWKENLTEKEVSQLRRQTGHLSEWYWK